MSESDGEQAARSLALEQAYVHEVYEQCAERSVQGKHWPRINRFLEELEPGALVCDIGCGNGKYLDVNRNVFKIGVDRCSRFTSMARENGNEVLTCDNLSLPFRDESFDAVLSIAVVHHFSTTERRVRALKELARVLRIGGRIVISVWAMEQKHRKFESQDVLVPWPKACCIGSTGSPVRARGMSYDERHRGGKNAQTTYLLSKSASQRKGSKNASKSYWIDPIFSPSPSTSSSLSSPNETCYSFFRRALQKLAGGRRNSRAWFLENWQNQRRHYDDEDDGDVDDLPIELRRLEEHHRSSGQLNKDDKRAPSHRSSSSSSAATAAEDKLRQRRQLQQQHSQSSIGAKSKSLGSIHEAHRVDIVRSRSSIPALCNAGGSLDEQVQQHATSAAHRHGKPKLMHQKTHYRGDDDDDDDDDDDNRDGESDLYDNTAIHQLLKDLPQLQQEQALKRGSVHKQSSMNEELMSIERLKERESVRRNIMKQASLNEELIYKSKPTLEALRDSFYSASASKRFQLLKSGLTNRIRQSTTNIEKVSGMSLKNGFVRILQSWTSTESPASATTTTSTNSSGADQSRNQQQPPQSAQSNSSSSSSSGGGQLTKHEVERRPSREDGSDSSKDSSLQSDTSVDSEDSFASVIFVPKKQSTSPLLAEVMVPPPTAAYQLNTTSAPPSPRVKYASELAGAHRTKLISVSPLLKQFPATSKSLPPPSPPGLSPRTLNLATMRPFFSGNESGPEAPRSPPQAHAASNGSGISLMERIAEAKRAFDSQPALPRMPSADSGHGSNGVASAQAEPVREPANAVPRPSQDRPADPLRRLSLQQLHRVASVESSDSDSDSDSDDGARRPDFIEEEASPLVSDAIDEALEQLSEKALGSSDSATTTTASATTASVEEEESRRSRLDRIKELLKQKPGFATRTRAAFPMVRRASTATGSRLETVTKVLPRLLSLELFNPETDDLDSDSSGVSSPESAGSVISVISDERYISKQEAATADKDKSSETDSVSPLEALSQKRPTALDTHISPVESTWSEECSRHLTDYTDRLKGTIQDIDRFCRTSKLQMDDDLASSRYANSKQQQQQQQQRTTDNNNTQAAQPQQPEEESKAAIERSCSEESSDAGLAMVSSSGECLAESEQLLQRQKLKGASGSGNSSGSRAANKTPSIGQGRYGNSIESSDIGDSISESMESSSLAATRRFGSGSTASLATSSSLTYAEQARARLGAQARSASEEIPSRGGALVRQQQAARRSGAMSASQGTLSGSSSQESLPSDQITYHQYYHVFREGELDQLIDKYVENLHIISSYYDHASWCVVAEKVQVWTI